ncbi:hypothetical protein B5X24_HaOG212964 [Helicoverpa armigera]|uniref:Tetraspanin n=1 Tax=Helicoverpa armigera TaxID=29058 RepID=A0A2W1BIS1_HELAM|nr:hypothetical protein B5X24_HaOG212964 [Helicoverpa armigera]
MLLQVTCILIMTLGLWIISSPGSLSTVIDFTGNATMKALLQDMLSLQVGIAVTAVAIFVFCISFMGFYGAITKSPFLLFMYSALVLLLLLLECALLYYFSSNLVEKGLQDDGLWTHAMRLAFKCCEHNATIPDVKKPPWSCCGPETYPDNCTATMVVKKDCQPSIYSALVLLLLLLECALLYYFSNNLVEKGLQDDGLWTHAMRLAFQCCEHNATIPDVKKPPWSCCGPDTYPDNCTSTMVVKKDCQSSIVSWLERYQLPIYTSLALIHVILSSCSIVRRSSSPNPDPPEGARVRAGWSSRVAPTVEPSSEDVIMLVVGRARIGWVDK